jgi:hypothetical protein
MSNISIDAPLVDGSLMPYVSKGESCLQAVELITGDDLRPPARSVVIEIQTASGKVVRMTIPNDADGRAVVDIDGDRV